MDFSYLFTCLAEGRVKTADRIQSIYASNNQHLTGIFPAIEVMNGNVGWVTMILFLTNYKPLKIFVFIMIIFRLSLMDIFPAESAGRRASDFRNLTAGAEYTAMGKSGGAVIDDVFSIYWNPAGLGELAGMMNFSSDNDRGNDGQITEDDLTGFSGDREKTFLIGASGAFIYDKSASGFLGAAFKALDGVIGAALLPVYSEDTGSGESGAETSASAGYLSYGKALGPASMGISLKAFYEKIGDYKFYGYGTDAGCQVEIVPFVRAALVIQDLATVFKPYSDYENINNKYDFSSQAVIFSAAISGIPDFIIAFTGIKVLDAGYEFNYGLRYDIRKNLSVSLGLNDYSAVSSGFSWGFSSGKISYALTYEWEDRDYMNIISMIYEI